ncbi:hypothetical protein HY385_02215 [Candidatus Daviesbacteria bacterium]|nr:hypothetical protein [Candidatus Daviesbacteria bacterium]
MSADLINIFYWWVFWLLISIIFLPLTRCFFAPFFDQGYAFAKILGILLISFGAWILGSLHILPFSAVSLFIIWLTLAITNSIIFYRHKTHTFPLKIFVLEEGLFLGGLIFWAFVRTHEPSIHGLEKFMDFGFINSILRSSYFPPADMWMSSLPINYYYFGHLMAAVGIKMTGLSPAVAYNLILATIFGLTLSASFSIGANLVARYSPLATRFIILGGFLSSFLVTLGGNLHTIYLFFQSYLPDQPIPFWKLIFGFNFSSYWYPNATRFIPYTIHEFPSYSFVVADLHGHVLSIPLVLLTIALLIKIFFSPKLSPITYALISLLIAALLMTNVLDGPIYLLGLFLIVWVRYKFFQAVKTVAVVSVLAIIFSLPFWIAFKPFSSGIGVLCAPQFLLNLGKLGPFLFEPNHCARSPLWMLLILWGFPLFITIGFLVKNWRLKIKHPTDKLVLTLALFALILIIIPEIFYVKDIYPLHFRANTVFKFGYQAFIILGLISGYMITRILTIPHKTIRYTLYAIPLFFLFLLVIIYPYFATNSYYNGLRTYRGLNGLTWLAQTYPADHQAIVWIKNNIKGQPIILEAAGDSYTDFARISANTGLPTVIGWPVHEWLWRGSYDEVGKRSGDVAQIYENPDLALTQSLIEKYNIAYVFIGILERQKYPKLNETKFQTLGKLVFSQGSTAIYQINQN